MERIVDDIATRPMKQPGITITALCVTAVAVATWIWRPNVSDSVKDHVDPTSRQSAAIETGRIDASPRVAPHPVASDQLPDTDGLAVSTFIAKLAPQARLGDVVAAMRIYRAEALCGIVEADAKMLATLNDDEMRASVSAWVATEREHCAGVTPAQIRERLVFLDEAVRAGSPEAMIAYRREGPDGFEPGSLDPNDPRLIAWKQNINTYMHILAAAGNYQAWSILSLDYAVGEVTPQDLRSSILYQAAITAARDPGLDPLSIGFVSDMARQLPVSDVQQAIQQGTELGRRFPALRKQG